MESLNLLKQYVVERFKAEAIIDKLEKGLKYIVEKKVFEKYKDKKILQNNMEYELFKVKSRHSTSDSSPDVNYQKTIELIYIVCSKLPKKEREILEKAKDTYINHSYMPYSNRKSILWIELQYDVSFEDIINDYYNLKLP